MADLLILLAVSLAVSAVGWKYLSISSAWATAMAWRH